MAVGGARPVVSVIGAGNGGLAIAGSLARAGSRVRLHDVRPEALDAVRQQGGIRMSGKVEGLASLDIVTGDPAEAVAGSQLAILVVAGPDQAAAAAAVAPHLAPDAVVLVKPGCTGGALEVTAALGAAGGRDRVVAEADVFVYACSIPSPGASEITAVKKSFHIAALPASGTPRALKVIRSAFPQAQASPTVLHTSLANMNAVLHVAPMIANAGRIEHLAGRFALYSEGITPAVARAVEVYDRERLAVATALGVEVPSISEWIEQTYGVRERSLHDTIQVLDRDVYKGVPAPSNLSSRYLTEDVPCGTVPVASLGDALGVHVPLHRRLVDLASLLCGTDFWGSGRTAARLGLAGLNVNAIRRFVEYGR